MNLFQVPISASPALWIECDAVMKESVRQIKKVYYSDVSWLPPRGSGAAQSVEPHK